jgi:excisionase family DNA binding protein
MSILEVPLIDDAYWAKFPEVLSINDLATITRKSKATIWRWLATGIIPAHQLGGKDGSYIVYRDVLQHRLEEPDVPYPLPTELLAQFGEELTPSEVATLLGRKRDTVYLWFADGLVPGHRLGGSWLAYKREIVEMLERTSNQTSDPSGK